MNIFLNKKIVKNKKIFSFLVMFLFLAPYFIRADENGNWFSIDWQGGLVGFVDIFVSLASNIFYYSAQVFDNLLYVSLGTTLLNDTFIKVLWSQTRDLANLAFLIGVLFTAFMMMSKQGNWQKTLINIIIVAFVLNFSLFASRVIVDAGNLSAHVFVKSISYKIDNSDEYFSFASKFNGVSADEMQSVGAAFGSILRPEKLTNADTFKAWQEIYEENGRGSALQAYLFIQFVLIIFYIIFAIKLFKAGFMFLGRLVWIIYYTIASPIFLVGSFLPGKGNMWLQNWLMPLLQKSFCIVIYLFFLWVAISILISDIVGNVTIVGGGGVMAIMGIFIIKAIFVIKMLDLGESLGKKFCEEGVSTLGYAFGSAKSITNFVGKTPIGWAGKSVARTMVGNIGQKVAKSELVHKAQASKSSLVSWTADRAALAGIAMQDKKIGGKSFAEDQNARLKQLRDLEDNMDSKMAERRRRFALGIANRDGSLDFSKVKQFSDTKKQAIFERMARSKKELEKAKNEDPNIKALLDKLPKASKEEKEQIHEQIGVLVNQNERMRNLNNQVNNDEKYLNDEAKSSEILRKTDKEISQEKIASGKDSLLETLTSAGKSAVKEGAGFVVASKAATMHRASEDQEVVAATVKKEEKLRTEREKFAEINKAKEQRKTEIDLSKDVVRDAVKTGNVALAKESLGELKDILKKYGLSDATEKIFEGIAKDMSELRAIEKREEDYENLKMYEDSDYKISDASEKSKFEAGLETLYTDNQDELKEIKKLLAEDKDWQDQGEMSKEVEQRIRTKYNSYKTNYEAMPDTKDMMNMTQKKIDRSLNYLSREARGVIDAEFQFNRARMENEIEREINTAADLAEQQAQNADVRTTSRATDHGGKG